MKFRVQGLGSKVQCVGYRVKGLGFRVSRGLRGLGAKGLGSRV